MGGQEESQRDRKRQHPLAHRHLRNHFIDQVSGGLGHASCAAGRANAAALTGKRDPEQIIKCIMELLTQRVGWNEFLLRSLVCELTDSITTIPYVSSSGFGQANDVTLMMR